ncbi:coiled-coil domain-containing protein 152 [Gouania willdenowi]|uniref:Coiled-coil domain-containing protein 152 n=1 Tax=Gouania willdenowi TaxID=441366 RepID=A0A8C5GVF0_GOUWI|nr:coiled-coil domain-containing protein 152 [Gouania willdenowi]
MTKVNCVHLDKLMEEFGQLEQKMTEVSGKNSMLEILLEDANRLVKFNQTKEKSLSEEKDSLLITVNMLQLTLQEQCNLRVENERLASEIRNLKEQKERAVEAGNAEVQRLLEEMKAEDDRRQRALQAVRQQCRREVEEAQREAVTQLDIKEAEVRTLLQKKDEDLEEMRRKLKDQERERHSEVLKLQMEFGAKLARVQSMTQRSQQQQQQQQHGSNLLPQSVFKKKLQFLQEEKNKEIGALRQRIRELEENQVTTMSLNTSNRLKRRKL